MTGQDIEIVLCGRTRERLWALPKGTPLDGESLAETAAREVQEETGLQVAIAETIGSIQYQFRSDDGTEYDKTVKHHLMIPVGGSLDLHDGEFDEVRWVSIDNALRLMRYPNEREIVMRAVALIRARSKR
jgi:8-oxo-dGTP pyrophosphatase MutT (NUDIX family)